MSNKNYTPQSAGEKAEKARKFATQLEGKSWATKNASQSDAVCNMFVDSHCCACVLVTSYFDPFMVHLVPLRLAWVSADL